MIKRIIVILFLLIAFPVWADQLIIEPDMGRKPILDAINSAQHSIDLVMYGFTDKDLLNAILKKKSNGKTIHVILERNPYKAENENKQTIDAFNTNQIAWLGHITPFRLIHQKTLILDESKAMVMTFNFTHSTFKNERNFALIIDDPQRVQAIASIFSADWNHVPSFNHAHDVIVSPDNSRNMFISLITHAQTSIQIYAQNLNDYKIVGVLAKAAKSGVTIQILTSKPLREKQSHYLTRAGIAIHYSQKFMIHAKVLIIDNQQAVIGSNNLTHASLDDNRELSVITHDPNVIKQLTATFSHDWNNKTRMDYPHHVPHY